MEHMGQGIQEWAKENLWKAVFEKVWSVKAVFHKGGEGGHEKWRLLEV